MKYVQPPVHYCSLYVPLRVKCFLSRQFLMPGPFHNVKRCYLLNKCTNMLLNLLEHSFCCLSLNEQWEKWQCSLSTARAHGLLLDRGGLVLSPVQHCQQGC